MRLAGKIAVVTGSANGIGSAIVRLFAAEGAEVYVTDRDGDGAEAVAAHLRAAGHKAHAASVDVTRGQDVTAFLRTVAAAHAASMCWSTTPVSTYSPTSAT